MEGMTGVDRPQSTPNARIGNVDALRGMALLLILLVNISFFSSGYPFHLVHDPGDDNFDRTMIAVVELLFAMKAYLLFSFLFGYSFTLQLESAARQCVEFVQRFRRRLSGLFVLGVLHAVLLFHGDILATYAVLGMVLLAARRLEPRAALTAAAWIVGGVAFLIGLAAVLGTVLVPNEAIAVEAGARSTAALQSGIGDVIVEHLRSLPAMLGGLLVQGPLALSAFLVGLAAGKRRMLADVAAHAVLLRRIELVGYPVGLSGAALFAVGGGTSNMTGLMVSVITAPFLAAAYASTALRLFQQRHRIANALAPAGRMALTNYLGQSFACLVIFTGVGFGLAGRTPPAQTILIALAMYTTQVAVSAWWMRRFRYGPAEWLLRAWTNRELPTMRLTATSPSKARG